MRAFTFTLPANLPISGNFGGLFGNGFTITPGTNGAGSTITFGNSSSTSGSGFGGGFPFFFKRGGLLEARDGDDAAAARWGLARPYLK